MSNLNLTVTLILTFNFWGDLSGFGQDSLGFSQDLVGWDLVRQDAVGIQLGFGQDSVRICQDSVGIWLRFVRIHLVRIWSGFIMNCQQY